MSKQLYDNVDGTRPGGYKNAIESDSPVVCFLYLLLRDVLNAGQVWELVEQSAKYPHSSYSNDFIAALAIQMAGRLEGYDRSDALQRAHAKLDRAKGAT